MRTPVGVLSALVTAALVAPVAYADGPAAGVVTPGWTSGAQLNVRRAYFTSTLLTNGKVLSAGGVSVGGGPSLASAELYDPVTDTWTMTGAMNVGRNSAAATRLLNGKVLVVGGEGPIASAEIYDPTTGSWTNTGSMNTPRAFPTATTLPNGKVLVTGGGSTSAEVYDPATATWTPTTAMATARDHSAAVLLPNGNVLVAGGDNVANKSSSQIYQPSNGVWLPKVDMGVVSDRPALAVLNTGKVLAAGGSVKIAQLYDLTTDTWTNTGSTAQEHPLNGVASLLPDGRVLLSGGLFGTGDRATEIFDPATGAWGSLTATNGVRAGHTATNLPTGQILLAGAFTDQIPVAIFTLATGLTATPLAFGDQTVGTSHPAAAMKLTNAGNVPLLVRGLKLAGANPGDFAVTADGCNGATVAVGASCQVSVSFTPAAGGARPAAISFRANTTTGTHLVALSGTGIVPATPTPTPEATPTPTPQPALPQPTPLPTLLPVVKPQLQATLGFTFKAGKTSTKMSTLTLKNLEKGVTVAVKCPKGCAKKTYTTTATKSSVSLKVLVSKALKVGTKLTITVSKTGSLGVTKTLTIRKSKAPSVVDEARRGLGARCRRG